MSADWVRLWHDMPTDPKWRVIARKSGQRLGDVLAMFSMLMVEASKAEQRGSIVAWRNEDAAAALDIDEDDAAAIFEAMRGRVHDGERLSGWEKRQPKREDDTAAKRKQEQREREKAEAAARHAASRNVTLDTDEDTDKSSEATASGGEPPAPDPKKVLFDAGVALLAAQGDEPKAARSLIGKWAKDYGGPAVMAALTAATEQRPAEAKAWITACLREQAKPVPEMTSNETALSDWITRVSPRMRADERAAWIATVLKPISDLPEDCIARGIRDAAAEDPHFPGDMASKVAKKAREWARLDRKPRPAARPPDPPKHEQQVDVSEVSALVAQLTAAKRSPDAGKAAA